jgi:hypothetical protein
LGHFYFLLALGAWVLLAFIFSLHRRFGRRRRLPYVADEALFSPGQRAFLAVLERALGRGYRVYGQVRAADVIALRRRPRLDRHARRRALARLGERRFDFLICRAETSAIACAVNLAPRSRLGRPPPRDALDRICAAAGLPFVRLREGDIYPAAEIGARVFEAMQTLRPPAVTVAEPRPAAVAPAVSREDREVLRSLSEMMVEDDRGPRLKSVPAPPRGAATAPRRAPAAPATPAMSAAPRVEPTLIGDGDVDLGPAFSIHGDLDEDERRSG